MSKHNAALCLLHEAALAPFLKSEGVRIHAEYPVALNLYASDIYNGAAIVGQTVLEMNAAILSHDLAASQRAAEIIENEAHRIEVLAGLYAKKISELRKRNPCAGVRR